MADNKRGTIRKRSDPVAIATRGRQTTYEWEMQNVVGVPTRLKTNSQKTRLKTRGSAATLHTITFTLDTSDLSKNDLIFDIGTGVLTNGG